MFRIFRPPTGWSALAARVFLGAFLGLLPATGGARGPWLEWKNCAREENDANDGDSFHVKADGQEYILRLYLVDAPESDNGFPERVAEQGKYFGIRPEQSLQLGELAARFVEEKLARPFTVRTSKQSAMGRSNSPRFYAVVETSEGDLGELLVANGLARVHGVAPAAEDSPLPKDEKQKLRRLEAEARRLKVGGWGATTGRMAARVPAQGSAVKRDPFDAFFHPERPAPAPRQVILPKRIVIASDAGPPAAAARTETKLNPNTATLAELIKLKGIGPVLAQRIVEARPFQSADELRRVKGIGAKRYQQIRPQFSSGDL